MQDSHTDNRAASASLNVTAPLDLDALSAALAKAKNGLERGPFGYATQAELADVHALHIALINAAPQMIAEITALREEQGRAMQAFGESLLADVADALDEANAPGLATATRQLAKQKVAASIAALNLEGAAS